MAQVLIVDDNALGGAYWYADRCQKIRKVLDGLGVDYVIAPYSDATAMAADYDGAVIPWPNTGQAAMQAFAKGEKSYPVLILGYTTVNQANWPSGVATPPAETNGLTNYGVRSGGSGALCIKSDNAGDTTQSVTVYGRASDGSYVSDTKQLNGASEVNLEPASWTCIYYFELSAVAAGTVSVAIPSGAALGTIAANNLCNGYKEFTLSEGGTLVYTRFIPNTENNTATPTWTTTPIATATISGAERFIIWKRTPPAGSACPWVLYSSTKNEPIPELLMFLRDAGIVGATPRVIYQVLELASGQRDADTGWGSGRRLLGYDEGLEALADWARDNDTIVACGLSNADLTNWDDDTYSNDQEIIAALQGNTDVFKFFVQDKSRLYWDADGSPYDTEALKIAAYDDSIAEWVAEGFDVSREGVYGFIAPYGHAKTIMSRKAMAMAGVRACRSWYADLAGAPAPNRYGEYIERFADPAVNDTGDTTLPDYYDLKIYFGLEGNYTTEWDYLDYNPGGMPSIQAGQWYTQQSMFWYACTSLRAHMMWYPFHLCTDPAAPDSSQMMLKVHENIYGPVMALAGSNMRYATLADWQAIALAQPLKLSNAADKSVVLYFSHNHTINNGADYTANYRSQYTPNLAAYGPKRLIEISEVANRQITAKVLTSRDGTNWFVLQKKDGSGDLVITCPASGKVAIEVETRAPYMRLAFANASGGNARVDCMLTARLGG